MWCGKMLLAARRVYSNQLQSCEKSHNDSAQFILLGVGIQVQHCIMMVFLLLYVMTMIGKHCMRVALLFCRQYISV
jgi:hypothetical protein